MKLNKERLYAVGKVVKEYSKVVIPVLGYVLFSRRGEIADAIEEFRYSGNATYDDAVKEIMNSNMFASYKTDIIKILKRGETSDYYKAVIHTVKSDVFASYKVNIISELNEKNEES